MNIIIFNSGLNIHTCTWIVSLTTLLKCLLNYGIKICQNVAYHLTIQKPYRVDRTMFGATSFVQMQLNRSLLMVPTLRVGVSWPPYGSLP
jgi:hypothetical protein